MRILLIRLSSFGDVVFTLPLAKALVGSRSGVSLAWAVEAPLAPLLHGAPYVHAVFEATTRSWRRFPLSVSTRREMARYLSDVRAFGPDLVVDAQGLFKSAWATFLAPAGRKVGFGWRTATERINCLATDDRVEARGRLHVADRALALAEHLTGRSGFDRTPDVAHLAAAEDAEVDAWLAARSGRPFALLQPFSSVRSKEWDEGSFAAFGEELARKTGLQPVVRWGPGERERAQALASSNEGFGLGPATNPASTARLASAAALFVGADTGPTHLAAALGVPTLALFGSTDPARFGPIGPRTEVLCAEESDYNRGRALAPSPHALFDLAHRLLAPAS